MTRARSSGPNTLSLGQFSHFYVQGWEEESGHYFAKVVTVRSRTVGAESLHFGNEIRIFNRGLGVGVIWRTRNRLKQTFECVKYFGTQMESVPNCASCGTEHQYMSEHTISPNAPHFALTTRQNQQSSHVVVGMKASTRPNKRVKENCVLPFTLFCQVWILLLLSKKKIRGLWKR